MEIIKKIKNIFNKEKISHSSLKNIEKLLIQADLSSDISQKIINRLQKLPSNVNEAEIKSTISQILLNILKNNDSNISIEKNKLNIFLLSGVNGSGKTSSLSKLLNLFHKDYKTAVAACDTFRAAALSQLKGSIEKKSKSNLGVELYQASQKYKDPSSLAYHAISQSLQNNFNILLIDTAGRLHNNINLMEELKKITKIIKKFENRINFHNFIVLDSTIGQNLINQVQTFKMVTDINGIILSKMDSSAKAGAIFTIQHTLHIPIYFITFGEKLDNIKKFNNKEFIDNLLDV